LGEKLYKLEPLYLILFFVQGIGGMFWRWRWIYLNLRGMQWDYVEILNENISSNKKTAIWILKKCHPSSLIY
jgi:hypothetical protein